MWHIYNGKYPKKSGYLTFDPYVFPTKRWIPTGGPGSGTIKSARGQLISDPREVPKTIMTEFIPEES